MSNKPQMPPDDGFLEERKDPLDLERWKSEVCSVGWSGLIPFRNFFIDKPWTLLWVQFMTFAFGFPFLVIGYYRGNSSSLAEVSWAFGIYFSIVWAVLIHRCIRPDFYRIWPDSWDLVWHICTGRDRCLGNFTYRAYHARYS